MDAKEFLDQKGIPVGIIVQGYTIHGLTDNGQRIEFNLTDLLTEFAQFQPTEKTREGAIECITALAIPNYNKALVAHLKEDKEHDATILCADANTKIIDTLIQSGYIQQSQKKNEKLEARRQSDGYKEFVKSLQSDSVDAELKSFLEFIAKERDAFVARFLMYPKTIETRVAAENLLIAYDQMKERLAGSKVKPVNEKMREALQGFVDFFRPIPDHRYETEQEKYLELAKKVLSTAPDDGWIPVEKELPKTADWVLVYMPDAICKVNPSYYAPKAGEWRNQPSKITHWQPLPKSPR